MKSVLLLVLLAGLSAEARSGRLPRAKPDPRTKNLGHSCKKSSECGYRSQKCLKLSDMNGKPQDAGFCVLPCAAIDAGTTKVIPGQPLDAAKMQKVKKKPPPPRCPERYLCHGADPSTPIDICVKD